MNERLTALLESALLRALRAAWRDVNISHFKGALRPCTLTLASGAGKLGAWRPATRTLELSRAFLVESSWGAVLEVLKHEMAHQYVGEVLGQPDLGHGPAFRALCERLGIDGRASGTPAPAPASTDEQRLLSRIAKLLALAESPNAHEAELAMAEAQRLMLRHNLDTPPGHGYGFRHLGSPTGRVGEAQRIVAALLGEHFFVETIWVPVWRALEGKRGSVLEVCGTEVNLEMAGYVHDFLHATAERLWREYRRSRRLRGNRERRTFKAGVMTGFREKLDAQRARHVEQGLVWVGDGDLSRYLRRRHPHVRFTRYGGNLRTEAHAHGRAAGREIVLHRPVAEPAQERGRFLPPGRHRPG